MRLSKRRPATIAGMNMTPMIDVVFLLLIFFMTVAQVAEVNRARLELPRLAGSEDLTRSTLTVNVDAGGHVIISGRQVSVADLLANVSAELAKVGHDPDRLTIVLRADRHGDCRTVNRIVTALARMQIRRVRIAVHVPR